MTRAKLRIEGMRCGGCALKVDDVLREVDGVVRVSTSFARGRTKIEYDEARVGLEALRALIVGLGYRPQ